MRTPVHRRRASRERALTRSEIMSRVGQRDTAAELALRRALWATGLRYRVNHRIGGIRVDVVFVRFRIAVFVDGCFWHGCPVHGTHPRVNRSFWADKLRANIARDSRQTFTLEGLGWTVLRLWEHDAPNGFADALHAIHRLMRRTDT